LLPFQLEDVAKFKLAKIEKLAHIIKENGWRAPITVSNQSGLIVKGHGRLSAAQKLNLIEVPVEYQDYKDESFEQADLMADNQIAELSYIDKRKLLNLFEEFDTGEVDFELSGFTSKDYQDLAHSFDEYEPKEDEEEEEEVKSKKYITCPNCGEQIGV
jgi:ParB-like chromosome segregation protein Spo0J